MSLRSPLPHLGTLGARGFLLSVAGTHTRACPHLRTRSACEPASNVSDALKAQQKHRKSQTHRELASSIPSGPKGSRSSCHTVSSAPTMPVTVEPLPAHPTVSQSPRPAPLRLADCVQLSQCHLGNGRFHCLFWVLLHPLHLGPWVPPREGSKPVRNEGTSAGAPGLQTAQFPESTPPCADPHVAGARTFARCFLTKCFPHSQPCWILPPR